MTDYAVNPIEVATHKLIVSRMALKASGWRTEETAAFGAIMSGMSAAQQTKKGGGEEEGEGDGEGEI